MIPGGNVAEIRRKLAAEPSQVFAAFADPALVSRWLKPSPEVRLEVLSFDFRTGGAYRFAYHVPSAGVMRVNGVFRSIAPPKELVFSWNIEPPDEHAGLESEVQVSITSTGSGCELRIRHVQLTLPGSRERHDEGWTGALDNLAAIVAGQDQTRHVSGIRK